MALSRKETVKKRKQIAVQKRADEGRASIATQKRAATKRPVVRPRLSMSGRPTTSGRASIQKNVVQGANVGGTKTRKEALSPLRTASTLAGITPKGARATPSTLVRPQTREQQERNRDVNIYRDSARRGTVQTTAQAKAQAETAAGVSGVESSRQKARETLSQSLLAKMTKTDTQKQIENLKAKGIYGKTGSEKKLEATLKQEQEDFLGQSFETKQFDAETARLAEHAQKAGQAGETIRAKQFATGGAGRDTEEGRVANILGLPEDQEVVFNPSTKRFEIKATTSSEFEVDPLKRAEERLERQRQEGLSDINSSFDNPIRQLEGETLIGGKLSKQQKKSIADLKRRKKKAVTRFEADLKESHEDILINEQGRQSQIEAKLKQFKDGEDDPAKILARQKAEDMLERLSSKVANGEASDFLEAKVLVDREIKEFGADPDKIDDFDKFQSLVRVGTVTPNNAFAEATKITNGNIEEAKKIIDTSGILLPSEMNNQLVDHVQQMRPNLSREEIENTYIKAPAVAEQQSGFLSGTLEDGDTVSYMDNTEVNSPDKAKRVYQKALDDQTYKNDPLMESLIKTRLARLGGGDGAGNTFEDRVKRFNELPSHETQAVLRMLKKVFPGSISNEERQIQTAEFVKHKDEGGNLSSFRKMASGYDPVDPDKEFAQRYAFFRTLGRTDPGDNQDINELIKAGQFGKAFGLMETKLTETVEKDFKSDLVLRTAKDQVSDLTRLVSDPKNADLLGKIEGTAEKFQVAVGLSIDKDERRRTQELASKMTTAVQKMRNEMLGSAVTPSEEEFLLPILPKMSDQPDQILIKSNSMLDELLDEHNAVRSIVRLPKLSLQTIDNDARDKMYMDLAKKEDELSNESSSNFPKGTSRLGDITTQQEGDPTTHAIDQDQKGNKFMSHGSFQMNRGVASAFANEMGFKSTDTESAEFKSEWDNKAKSTDFREKERAFIKKTLYEPHFKRLKIANLPDSLLNNERFQDLIFDVSVNAGANTDMILRALNGKKISSIEDAIDAVEKERLLRSEGHPMQSGLQNRIRKVSLLTKK